MKKSIRWLLTESKISNLDTNKVSFVDGKLICYHLTSHQKWAAYNPQIADKLDNPLIKHPKQERSKDDSRAVRILKNLKDSNRVSARDSYDVEEEVIMDMIRDPYTDTSGFSAGYGDYHGKGLYTCYKFNPKIASNYGNICLVFEIDISNFIITFEDLAKQVHGDSWTIKDQLLRLYQLEERSPSSIQKFKKILSEISDDELKLPKSIYSSSARTANISLRLMRSFSKIYISAIYDGVILFGTGDGPVCCSFYPKYDAKLIGLGRLNEDRPEIVDWYDSLDDFLGGRAKLKQDFETINAIAEESTDPVEKSVIKKEDRPPFDMDYLEITDFFKSFNQRIQFPEDAVNTLFKYYENAKSSIDNRMFEFFLESFKNSRFIDNNSVVKTGAKYNELIDEVIKHYTQKDKNLGVFFFSMILDAYNDNSLMPTDFFMTNAINRCLSDKAFKSGSASHSIRSFNYKVNTYLDTNSVSPEIKSLIEEKRYEFGAHIVMLESNIEKVLEYYSNADETNKNIVVSSIINDLHRVGTSYWRDVSPQNFKVANELLESVVDSLNKTKSNPDYEIDFVRYLLMDMPDVDYFSNKIDEFIASSFLKNMDKIKNEPNTSFFINTIEYISRKLGSSHPVALQIEKIESQDIEQAGNNIEIFIEKLNLGQVTNRQLKNKIEEFKTEVSYISYLNKQSKDWFKKLFSSTMKNVISKNFKVLGKIETSFLLAIIMCHDIALTKEEQFAFTRKFGKSDYDSKNNIANYKHIDPDVFIELLGPDLEKGGMGAGLSFKGFEYSPGVYRLLYKHRKIVDLFCDVARPGLMKMIVLNLNAELVGHPNPPNTWGNSGMLKSGEFAYIYNTLPYLDRVDEQIKISEAVNMDDIAWFEYFISRAKKSPKRGVAKVVSTLEKNLNDKKLKNQTLTSNQSSDDLDPQLDLSHRKILGNSLKEVYGIEVYGKIDESVITDIKNFFARPKFNGDKLVVYHRTTFEDLIKYNPYLSSEDNKDDVENLKDSEKLEKALQDIIGDPLKRGSGFRPGARMLHGRGLYSCYTFKKNQAEGYGNIILAFEVDISNYLIGDRNLAIRVHGINFTPKQQFLKIIKKRYPERLKFFKEQWEIQFSGLDIDANTDSDYNIQDFFENDAGTKRFLIFRKIFKGYVFKDEKDGDVCVSDNPKDDVQLYKIGVEGNPFEDSNDRGKLVLHDSLDSLLQGKSKNKDSFKTINQQKNKDKTQISDDEKSNNQIIANQILRSHNINHIKIAFEKSSDLKDLVACFENSPEIHASSSKLDADNKPIEIKFQISNFNMNNASMNYNILDGFLFQVFRSDENYYYKLILTFFNHSNHKDFYIVNAINRIINEFHAKIKSSNAKKIIKIVNDNQEYKKYFLNKLAEQIKRSGRFQQKNKETLMRILKNRLINLDLADSDLNDLKFENKIYKAKSLKEVYNF